MIGSREAAKIIGVSTRQMRKLAAEGRIPGAILSPTGWDIPLPVVINPPKPKRAAYKIRSYAPDIERLENWRLMSQEHISDALGISLYLVRRTVAELRTPEEQGVEKARTRIGRASRAVRAERSRCMRIVSDAGYPELALRLDALGGGK